MVILNVLNNPILTRQLGILWILLGLMGRIVKGCVTEVSLGAMVAHGVHRRRMIFDEQTCPLKLPRPGSVETEIEERGVSIQKAQRRKRHDYPARC